MMTALYIIGGIAAYLLIGSVVAGLGIRRGKITARDATPVLWLWWIFIILEVSVRLNQLQIYLAKRIGGVK